MFVGASNKHVIFEHSDSKCCELSAQVIQLTTHIVNGKQKNNQNFVKNTLKTSKPMFGSVIIHSVDLWKLHLRIPPN